MKTALTITLTSKRRFMRLTSILFAPVMAAALIAMPNQADAKVKDTTKVTATWITPANGSILTAPAMIVLSVDAEAKQANQPIVSVEFFNGATLIGTQTTASSGLNYQVSWPNVSPGTYSLTATATNDKGDFDTTDPVTITVIKANQSIGAFSPLTPITYAPNASFTLTVTGGASANPIIFASTTPATCSVSGSTVTIQSAGTCTVTADQAGNINYNAAPQAVASVTVNRANQSISGFTPASPITYAPNASFNLTATGGASGNLIILGSNTPIVCSVTGNVATIQSAGMCRLTADQADNTNYNTAVQMTANVTINKADQAITGFIPSTPITYSNGGTFSLTATGGASGNSVNFASTTSTVCSVTGNVATILSVGTCTVTADQAGNVNYNPAIPVTANIVINKANQIITGFTPATPITYTNGGSFTLTASGGASGNAVTFASTTPTVCSVTGNVAMVLSVGTCTLTADQAGTANYIIANQVTVSVVINKIAQTITGFSPASQLSLAAGGSFTLSATGGASGNPVTFTSSTTAVCATGGINGATVTVVTAGICTLTANQTGDATYNAATPVSATVSITILAAEGQIYYIHADHLGTPRAITRPADNQVVWKWENSDPFGANAPNEDPANTGTAFKYNLRFPGQYADVETGTHYNYFRDYDPATGRYVQSDPLGLVGGISTYAYANSNPIIFIDPDGRLCIYSQGTGSLRCTNDRTNAVYLECEGYSGTGTGRNNPDAQDQANTGPLNRGDYTVGGSRRSTRTGPGVRDLTPAPGNDMRNNQGGNRSDFQIHGDNARNDASNGCIILSRSCRDQIPAGETLRVAR